MVRILIILAILSGGAWAWYDFDRFRGSPVSVEEGGEVYEIPAGTSFGAIASDLERRGIVRSALWLRALARLRGFASRVRSGEYLIASGTKPEALLEQLVAGRVIQHAITFVEGWDFRKVRAALESHPALVPTLEGRTDAQVMEALGRGGEHPEGQFFPDTYFFPRGTADTRILEISAEKMADVLARQWKSRASDLPLQTPYESLILASIIEKETGLPEERAAIAGVFVRRLEKGMRLQTDPTVIYGLGESFDGDLRRRDLEADTPYNTYTRSGLPPTPICIPGEEAIHAALHPEDGNSLYFVARGDGSHEFSRTLDAHNRAVRQYQLRSKARDTATKK